MTLVMSERERILVDLAFSGSSFDASLPELDNRKNSVVGSLTRLSVDDTIHRELALRMGSLDKYEPEYSTNLDNVRSVMRALSFLLEDK